MRIKTPLQRQAICMIISSLWAFTCSASAIATEKVTLKNGIKVLLIPIKDSSNINIVTWVPLGLCHDENHRAQWSHLVEHLVSQSTGQAPFDEINAETLPDGMHLDYSRPANTWKDGIDYHARWLALRRVTKENFEREVPRVIQETESVADAGFTHKFAFGAWALAVRFGTTNVEMLGNVRNTNADELFEYYKKKFLAGRAPVIAVSGSFDREALLKELENRIGKIKLPAQPKTTKPDPKKQEIPSRITWDLPTRHLVFYWPLPDVNDRQRAELLAASKALLMSWHMAPAKYRPANSYVAVEDHIDLLGQSYFVVNMTIRDANEDTLASARKDMNRFVQSLLNEAQTRQRGRVLVRTQHQQFENVDRTVEMSQQQRLPDGRTIPRKTIEGNIAVQLGMLEFRYNGKLADHAQSLANPDDAKAIEFLQKVLDSEKHQELVIKPKN